MSATTQTVGKAVNEYVRQTPEPTYEDVVSAVSDEVSASSGEVRDAIEKLVANGFIYKIEEDGATVVKVA